MKASLGRGIGVALLALLFVAASAATATAELGPIRLISRSAGEQADSAAQPAISADGRYVAFRGSIGGLTGIFRKDLTTATIDLVVGADAYASPAPPGRDASSPAISADGRYVSFTTSSRLDLGNDSAAASNDVYVRDMALPAAAGATCGAAPCAFELVSAADGSAQAMGGASSAAGSALSADGRRLAFVNGGQVYLRELDANRTILISVKREGGEMKPGVPVPAGAVASGAAALSADGSAVAWVGANLPSQVPMLGDEVEEIANNPGFPYREPLWRLVPTPASPVPPTRRIIGGGDPLAPGCPAGGSIAEPACQGPFLGLVGLIGGSCDAEPAWSLPSLSADGLRVALVGSPNLYANAFLVDMRAGLSRRQAVRQLTREVPFFDVCEASLRDNLVNAGQITQAAISADGERIAFVTSRQQFPLAPPLLLGPPPVSLGLTELYRIDLQGEVIERVTGGAAGAPSSASGREAGAAGASSPSFDAAGTTLAFASFASNLAGDDVNGESDVFTVFDPGFVPTPGASAVTPPVPGPRLLPAWRMWTRASSRRDGSVWLFAAVPGAGSLRARVRGGEGSGPARLGHRLLSAGKRARRAGVIAVPLRLKRPLRRLVHSADGLAATVRVVFVSRGHKALRDELDVTFRARQGRGADRAPGSRRGVAR